MKRNITEIIERFNEEKIDLNHRYNSFDFCYAHFRESKSDPAKRNIEKSCQVLWSYLASWGMLRGSSFLLQKNPAYLKELVEWIYDQPESTWNLDVQDYKEKQNEISALYEGVKEKILKGEEHQHLTLVTKILLGVFAVVPAYDRFFTETFKEVSKEIDGYCGFTCFDERSLNVIYKFYFENRTEIDKLSNANKVKSFDGSDTQYNYSKAKIIDMYGFYVGFDKSLLQKK